MDPICNRYTIAQLKDKARGKIPGFSRLNKEQLCHALIERDLLQDQPPAPILQPEPIFQGLMPPDSDFDKLNPIPPTLLPYDYLYGAGSNKREIARYFILPDDYPLIRRSFIDDNQVVEVPITVADFYTDVNDDIIRVYIGELDQRQRTINQVAPRIGSRQWDDLLMTMAIVNVDREESVDPQIRRHYQIITTPIPIDRM